MESRLAAPSIPKFVGLRILLILAHHFIQGLDGPGTGLFDLLQIQCNLF